MSVTATPTIPLSTTTSPPVTAADGHVTEISIRFNAPCKTYPFRNIIGELYFVDEKSIASRNSACPVEAFNTSYGGALQRQ